MATAPRGIGGGRGGARQATRYLDEQRALVAGQFSSASRSATATEGRRSSASILRSVTSAQPTFPRQIVAAQQQRTAALLEPHSEREELIHCLLLRAHTAYFQLPPALL